MGIWSGELKITRKERKTKGGLVEPKDITVLVFGRTDTVDGLSLTLQLHRLSVKLTHDVTGQR